MTEPIRSFKDLDAWDAAMTLAVQCYRIAKRLPPEERFEMSAQIRRAAVSVPANIAEGHASGFDGIFARHVRIALGSLGELDTLLELTIRAGLLLRVDTSEASKQLVPTTQIAHGLARSIRKKRLKKVQVISLFVAVAVISLL